MSNQDVVLVEQQGGVQFILLNRPEHLNAINLPLLTALKQAVRRANEDAATNVIVLKGVGTAFCAGKDLKDHQKSFGDRNMIKEEISLLHDINREILFGEKIVIAGVHGWAAGGGLELLITCDLVVLAESAQMFFPEMSLGLFITCGVTTLLPRIIGLSQARAIMLTGERLDAPKAKELGLAWQVIADEDFEERLREIAVNLSALPQTAQRQLKRVMIAGMREEIENALNLEAEIAERNALDPESQRYINRMFSAKKNA